MGIELSEAKNYQKQRIKITHIHESIENQRLDFLHKLSTKIVKNHDISGMESLDIIQMFQIDRSQNKLVMCHGRSLKSKSDTK